jgi:hypothetical protein
VLETFIALLATGTRRERFLLRAFRSQSLKTDNLEN